VNPIVIIPSRFAASRLPGKPLADIHGTPMIVHVARRAMETNLGPVWVATDHDGIAQAVRDAGFQAVLTRAGHPSGTDRIAEALSGIDPDGQHDVVVNFQGDLPTVAPHVLHETAALLAEPAVELSTAVALIHSADEAAEPGVVKMAGSPIGPARFRALYFSRLPVPWGEGPLYHHIGLYVWRRAALDRFVKLPPSALETREKLEQLRALEAGMRIDAALVQDVPLGVDTPADLEKARSILRFSAPPEPSLPADPTRHAGANPQA
jgi:3-deoxy-manno-octulosonate cytidylyltransferase (CMP-KDO synthetase)